MSSENLLILSLSFVVGLFVGSFLNVVSLRYGSGLSISRGRSKCFSCGHSLGVFDLVPFFSFFFLQGRCRYCGSKISLRYPLVEFVTGIIFSLVAYKMVFFGFSLTTIFKTILAMVAFSSLVVIALYDLRHKVIPEIPLRFFWGSSLVFSVISFYKSTHTLVSFLDLSAILIVPLPLFLLWLMSKGRWIGFGDSKLTIGIGAMLGLAEGLSALVLAFWIGAAFSVFALMYKKILHHSFLRGRLSNITMKTEVPFAPFLAMGTILAFAFNLDIFSINIFLSFLSV